MVDAPARQAKPQPYRLLALSVGLLAVAAVLVWISELRPSLDTAVALANLVVCIVGLVYSAVRGLRPVAMVFFVFMFGWLAFAPVYQLLTGRLAWLDSVANHPDEQVTAALLLNLTATTCFFVGHWIAVSRRAMRPHAARVSGKYLLFLGAFATLITVFAVRQLGGFSVLFSSRGERWEALEGSPAASGGLTDALTRVLPAALAIAFAILAVTWIRAQGERGPAFTARTVAAALFALALLGMFANPFSASRFIAIAAWGAVALAAFRPRSSRAGFATGLIGLIAILIVYPYGNAFRDGLTNSTTLRVGLEAFVGPDFDGFQQVMNALAFVDDRGHSNGWYLLSALGYAVPRSMWPEKAIPASIDVATNAGYWFTNLSLPIHAELFVEFGVLGVALGLGGLGYLAGRLDRAWLSGTTSVGTVLAPFVALAMLGVMRGPLGALVPIYLTAGLLIALGLRREKRTTRMGIAVAL